MGGFSIRFSIGPRPVKSALAISIRIAEREIVPIFISMKTTEKQAADVASGGAIGWIGRCQPNGDDDYFKPKVQGKSCGGRMAALTAKDFRPRIRLDGGMYCWQHQRIWKWFYAFDRQPFRFA